MRYLVNFQAKNFYDKKTFGLRLVSWGRGSRIYNRPSALADNLGSSLSPTILAAEFSSKNVLFQSSSRSLSRPVQIELLSFTKEYKGQERKVIIVILFSNWPGPVRST